MFDEVQLGEEFGCPTGHYWQMERTISPGAMTAIIDGAVTPR